MITHCDIFVEFGFYTMVPKTSIILKGELGPKGLQKDALF